MYILSEISWLQAALLGLLQGVTEFLPVSSTAHMDIVPQLFHRPDPGAAFSAVAQLGPIVAIIAYFRSDLARYVHGILRTGSPANLKRDDVDARLGWFTLLGTIPLCIFGLALEHYIDHKFRQLSIVAYALIVLAVVLWAAEVTATRAKSLGKMTFADSQVIGWAQVLALIPGTSRSGVTITAGLFRGLDRESAARFSFLLSIPAITLAGLYKLLKALKAGGLAGVAGPSLLAAVVAGIFAYVVIRWFLGYMREHSTGVFILYRIALGIAILYMLHTGALRKTTPETITPPGTAQTTLSVPAIRAVAPRQIASAAPPRAGAVAQTPTLAAAAP